MSVVLFAREPRPGRVKTRLVPPLSPAQASKLAGTFLEDSLARVGCGLEPGGATLWLAWDGERRPPVDGRWEVISQGPGGLGQRLARCLAQAGSTGDAVIALGADSPTMPSSRLGQAVSALDEGDVVIGPSLDGGYYLLGLREASPAIFEGIPWSTSKVLSATRGRMAELGLTLLELAPWYDVDRPEDLWLLAAEVRRDPKAAPHTAALLQAWESSGQVPILPPPRDTAWRAVFNQPP